MITPSTAFRLTRGFSLIELVMSMAVLAVIMAAVSSTVMLASRAVPAADASASRTAEASRALAQIAAELETAIEVQQVSSNLLTFVVSDRNGDGSDEVIQYTWSGRPGAPLQRQVNGQGSEDVIAQVTAIDLATTITQVPDSADPPAEWDDPVVAYDVADHNTRANQWYPVEDSVSRFAQRVTPSVGDATKYRVDRVSVFVRGNTVAGDWNQFNVVIRGDDGAGGPSTSTAYTQTFKVNAFDGTNGGWAEIRPTTPPEFDAGMSFYYSVEYNAGDEHVEVQTGIDDASAFHPITKFQNSRWETTTGVAMHGWVEVTPWSADPDWEPPMIDLLQTVTLSVTVGADGGPTSALQASVQCLNQPEAP